MVTATFRFHDELNGFLSPMRREIEFSVSCARNATTKHMIEALGVPHTEVELITVHGAVAGFDRLLQDGDRVAVYPGLGATDAAPRGYLREWPLEATRFIADVHLGGLARLMRMAGFDTLCHHDLRDRDIANIAISEARIVLTRDRDLLMLRDIIHGCYVHALRPEQQFVEIMGRLKLSDRVHPFSLCLECNTPLQATDKSQVLERLPPSVQACHDHFTSCPHCGRVFWQGSHWRRMRRLLDAAIGQCVQLVAPMQPRVNT